MSWLLKNLALLLVMMTSFLPMTSSQTHYLADVRIYVEQSAYNRWMDLTGKTQEWQFKQEMKSTIVEVNLMLRTLERYDVYLQMQIERVVILNTDILNPDNNGQINSGQSTVQFLNWLNSTTNVQPHLDFKSTLYDVAILYTKVDLISAAGVVYDIGVACWPPRISVVELHATFDDVIITGHEMGHIFGAKHDGLDESAKCVNNSGWLSNSHIKNSNPNRYYFSSCSATHIKGFLAYLNRENNNCLTKSSVRKEVTGPRYASLMTFDQICQRSLGSESYIVRDKYSTYGDDVCDEVACKRISGNDTDIWFMQGSPGGLLCGKNKRCMRGECLTTFDANPSISDSCPFGDQPQIKENGQVMTCSQMDATKCLKWHRACCQTCQTYSWNPANADPGTADDVCRGLAGSGSSMARGAYATYGDNICSHLACVTTRPGTPWEYFRAPDGMKCGTDKRCRNGLCIFSLHNSKEMTDSCPYGDQPSGGSDTATPSCDTLIKLHGCSDGVQATCCSSCGGPGTADQVCRKLLGPGSSFVRRSFQIPNIDMCATLYCLSAMSGTTFTAISPFTAPDGMKCGMGKKCSGGKCVSSPSGDHTMSDTCPFGDQPRMTGDYQATCKDYAGRVGCDAPKLSLNITCCDTCKTNAN